MDAFQELLLILGVVPTTLLISILSFLLGLAIGILLAFARTYGSKSVQNLIDVYEKVFRGVPELVLMLLLFYGVGRYIPIPFRNAFFAATFALGLRSSANQSQIFRGAIRGIGEEQMVAGRSLGLSRIQSVLYVMIPQVFIFSTPGLGSEYALLVKDSSYSFVITVVEIMAMTDWIRKATLDTVTPYLIAAPLYILLTFPIATWLDTWGSRKKKQLGL